MATLTISVYPSDTACSHTWRGSRDWRLPYLGHRSPLGTHSQPVAGILHVAAGDGEVGDVVGAEEGGPHLELAVGGVGVLSGQQTGLTQRLNTVTVSITETFWWTLTLQTHLSLPTIKPKKNYYFKTTGPLESDLISYSMGETKMAQYWSYLLGFQCPVCPERFSWLWSSLVCFVLLVTTNPRSANIQVLVLIDRLYDLWWGLSWLCISAHNPTWQWSRLENHLIQSWQQYSILSR